MKTTLTALLLGLAMLCACSDNDEPNPVFETDLTEITTHTENGITITLFAQEDFFVGFNSIITKIEDADGKLISGTAEVTPMMDMMTMQHSCPLELPNANQIVDGRFEFNTVFVMPSGDMGNWSVDFTINETSVSVPVEVKQPQYTRLTSFVSQMDGTTKYFVALVEPSSPKVGQNDIEVAIYKKETMMEWPAVNDLTLEMEPWMVSMDHGSPNNIAPAHDANGHYTGKVNFTMTGDWQIRLKVKLDDTLCGEPFFDLMFQ